MLHYLKNRVCLLILKRQHVYAFINVTIIYGNRTIINSEIDKRSQWDRNKRPKFRRKKKRKKRVVCILIKYLKFLI